MSKVLVIGEKYSDNLGDGIISDCICYAIKKAVPEAIVETLDLSLRNEIAIGSKARNDNSTSFFNVYFRRIKRLIGWFLIRGPRYVQYFRDKSADASAVVVGGGQLFLDTELNFPLKLYFLEKSLRKVKRKYVYACGVAPKASVTGALLMKKFSRAIGRDSFYVRDIDSTLNASNVLGVGNAIAIVDPAFVVSELYTKQTFNTGRTRKIIGLNIMDSGTLCRLHKLISKVDLENFWHDNIKFFIEEGFDVLLHTNGALEDNEFLKEIISQHKSNPRVSSSIPNTPEELCKIISSLDFLVAFRLHAQIVAYSYGVKSIGFAWDVKVRSFSQIIGREDFFLDMEELRNNEQVGIAIKESLETEIDENRQKELKNIVYESISKMIND